MTGLLLVDLTVFFFGAFALYRAIRLLGYPPVKSRVIDYLLVFALLIVYPGSRFTGATTYETVMQIIFASPIILLVLSGCVMCISGMVSTYLGSSTQNLNKNVK
jgi:hypothetical protein